VVLISIAVHGGATLVVTRLQPATIGAARPLAVGRAGDPALSSGAAPVVAADTPINAVRVGSPPADDLLITVEEMIALRDAGAPVIVGDARATDSYLASAIQARGAVRIDPDMPVFNAQRMSLPKDAWIVLYCT
ncbi:MAG: hypothetical protein NZ518_07445, partial [Dehalococcoidia bacterium]|nr:hypothetical protein [Dehalococcoidia bacterium]